MRKRMRVSKDLNFEAVFYKSANLSLLGTRWEKNKKVYIICEGLSMSVDDKNHPCKWDPGMTVPSSKDYSKLDGDIISMYFPFECAGLENAGNELAEYVNYDMKNYRDIVIIGHSKGGVCIANMARWLKRKCTLVSVSAPFMGTIMTDAEKIKQRLTISAEYEFYERMYNNHNVDKDILPLSPFLQNADFSGIQKHSFYNVISETLGIHEPIDLGCKYLNYRLGYEHGDGIVTVISQQLLTMLYPEKVTTIYMDASHANSLKRLVARKKKYII